MHLGTGANLYIATSLVGVVVPTHPIEGHDERDCNGGIEDSLPLGSVGSLVVRGDPLDLQGKPCYKNALTRERTEKKVAGKRAPYRLRMNSPVAAKPYDAQLFWSPAQRQRTKNAKCHGYLSVCTRSTESYTCTRAKTSPQHLTAMTTRLTRFLCTPPRCIPE